MPFDWLTLSFLRATVADAALFTSVPAHIRQPCGRLELSGWWLLRACLYPAPLLAGCAHSW